MSRSFIRISMLLMLMFAGRAWAIGLGDINLDSALNEPLRAEIVLLSASPDELADLTISMASAETFARYGIDRPFYLQSIQFNVVDNGQLGSVVQVRSRSAITEPFLTFLVEATWSSGRLLREYTVLLDPPTYAAPSSQSAPVVEAPRLSTPSDSGQIQRPATPPPQESRPAPQPAQTLPVETGPTEEAAPDYDAGAAETALESPPQPPVDNTPFGTIEGGDLVVQRGDTLWGIASRNRPDQRLTMNQTMLAIYEANRDAFGGNINLLKAGASLRIPSADDVFQISRGDAINEVQRQHSAWSGDTSYSATEPSTRPSLTLVPPDDAPVGGDFDDDASVDEPQSREQEIEGRIAELEAADVPNQPSLIQIRDNELAVLRQELADIRGEIYEAPVDDTPVDDSLVEDPFVDETGVDDAGIDDIMADDTDEASAADVAADDTADLAADTVDVAPPSDVITTAPSGDDQSIVDTAIAFLSGIWEFVIGALVLVVGGLVWFMRRGSDGDDVDIDRPWETLDADEMAGDSIEVGEISATSTMEVPTPEEAIVVVEQDSGVHPIVDDTVEAPAAEFAAGTEDASGTFGSIEDTFSSETAVNLDQTDPIAEADFHMAYGLYDQAADLINGALETDPTDKALMSKLCEVYFVWGNRDAFVDAASRLKASVGDGDHADWDKIVIMGQQIAADDALFAGAEVVGATKAVDLSFDDGGGDAGALDMDFGAEESGDGDVIDMGASDDAESFGFGEANEDAGDGFDLDVTAESPTLEEPISVFSDSTSELPSLDHETLEQAVVDSGQDTEATSEINLEELDLDVQGMDQADSLDDFGDLDETGRNETLGGLDLGAVTGKNPAVDQDSTGIRESLDIGATGLVESIDPSDLEDSGMHLAPDETGQHPMAAESDAGQTDVDFDETFLDATGRTQVLSDTMAVETAADITEVLSEAEATLVAPTDDEGEDFDFAKTEALPAEAFSSEFDIDVTAEAEALAGTDVDLDLDDLTAALHLSEVGDTVQQPREEETVQQPRPEMPDETAEIPTMSLAPGDLAGDLADARTMTEVGTKLDLARAYVDMGDPTGARSILEEVLNEGDEGQKQQAQQLLDSLPS